MAERIVKLGSGLFLHKGGKPVREALGPPVHMSGLVRGAKTARLVAERDGSKYFCVDLSIPINSFGSHSQWVGYNSLESQGRVQTA